MGTLRCPMCCKRKFRSQLSLKYHILSYMYNIFCTLCWRRVESLQEVLDHLDVGCDKAYAAGWRDGRARHAAVQTQVCIWPLTEEVQDTSAQCSCHVKQQAEQDEAEGSLIDDDSWTLMDCEDDATPDVPVGHEPAGQGSGGCDTRDGAMPDHGRCNTNVEHSKPDKSPQCQRFACDACRTTFLCVEEHVRLHHSDQDVEVLSRNSSVLQFPKSRWEEFPGESGGETTQNSVAQDIANEENNKGGQTAADSLAPESINKPGSLLEKALNGAGTSDAKFVRPMQRLNRCAKPSGNNKYQSDKETMYINHRDTEHSYSSTCTKAFPYALHAQGSSVVNNEPKDDTRCDKGKKDSETQSDISKDKILCVCGSDRHRNGDKQKLSKTAIEFSEAIPKLFSQKNGKDIPTVVVFRGNKLSSILTPMTSRVNMKSLQRCTTLQELVSVIGSQTEKTYRSAAVKSTVEPVFRDSSGIAYSDSVHNSTVEGSESRVRAMEKEASRERVMDDGKHDPVFAFARKRMRNETEFTVKKSVDSNGKVINNTYRCCNCGGKFHKYLSFCKHDCDGVTNDCNINFTKKSMLTVQFTGVEPEVDSQKSVIEIGLGVNTEPEAQAAGGGHKEERETVMAGAANNDMVGVHADVNCDAPERQQPKKFGVGENLLASQTWVCHICAIVFKSRVSFVGHQRMHAPKVVRTEHNADGTPVCYTCRVCSFVAEHRRGLKQHMRVHLPEELEQHCTEVRETSSSKAEPVQPETFREGKDVAGDNGDVNALNYSCKLCGLVFPELARFDEHVLADHPDEDEYMSKLVGAVVERAVATGSHTYTCEICLKKIDVVFRQVHAKTHLGDERYVCEICKINLYTREQFNLHVRAHEGDNPYLCRVCKKKFTSLDVLEKHILSHNGSKRYACRFCDRCFKRPITRVEHERMHTGEKPFSCCFCGMRFRLKGTRELHMRIHTGVRPYSCKVCKKCFRSHNSLSAHVATHSDERNFKCSLCPKAYKTAVSLSTHKKNHTKPYKCEICQRRFISSYLERQHRLSHSAVKNGLKYKCIVCGMMYARPFALRDHMSTHVANTTDQPLQIEDASDKCNLDTKSMEIVDESTQTIDYSFVHVDEECMEAAQFLVVDSNKERLETESCVMQVMDEGEASVDLTVKPEEFVANIDNEDTDCPGSIPAFGDDLNAAEAYLIADNGECQQVLLVRTDEGASVSQYILQVAGEETTITQSASSEIDGQLKPSEVVQTREQGVDGCLVDFSNHMDMGENGCVTPFPVNFEEVKTDDINTL